LIFGGLAVSVAFRGGLFNIGARGTLLVGAILAAYVSFAWHLPAGLHVIVAILAGRSAAPCTARWSAGSRPGAGRTR